MTRKRAWASAYAVLLASQVALGADAARAPFELGNDVFFHETFAGNGRTCATCHDPTNEFSMSPQAARTRYEADPTDPLFRPIDSDDGRGNSYGMILDHALFKVTIPLPPGIILLDTPSVRSITVLRGVPSIANVALTAPYQVDGRAPTLQDQARGAINGHMQASRKPTFRELDALATFEREMFYPLRLRSLRDATSPLPAGFSRPVLSQAALRGKDSFDLHCARCHSGELADRQADPANSHFQNVFVSDHNSLNLPLIRLGFRRPDGSVVETVTPDPGLAAITGDIHDLNKFDTPSLRGVKHTAPYFHDNSSDTLEDVIEHYNEHFQFQIGGQELDDLLAFLETL